MMKRIDAVIHVLTILSICASLSCSGGGGDTLASGGIGGTGVTSSGEVTDFGSIWINGIEFDTRQAEIFINNTSLGIGDTVVLENLDVGRLVSVKGRTYDTLSGTADQVFYVSSVTGPVEAIEIIDAYTTQLTVLGQEVVIDDRTRFKGTGIDDLAVGNLVDASGLIDASGHIVASFLEKTADAAPPDATYYVSGPVSSIGAGTFSINDLTVDFSGAEISGVFPSGIENGTFVSISGRLDGGHPAVFAADTLQPYLLLGNLEDGDHVEFTGYIFDQPTADRFHINGYLAEVSSDTQLIGGSMSDILQGTKIKVEGYFSDGAIIVQEVVFSASMKAQSHLVQKNDVALTMELTGLESLTIRTNSLTRFIGLAHSFATLTVGDHVVVRGHLVENQTAVADQVIALPASPGLDRVEIQGTVTALGRPLITINGVQIDTDLIPSDGFSTYNDAAISQEDFFAMVGENDPVEASGDLLADDSVVWQSISLIRLQ
jgi:hypothetical protein